MDFESKFKNNLMQICNSPIHRIIIYNRQPVYNRVSIVIIYFQVQNIVIFCIVIKLFICELRSTKQFQKSDPKFNPNRLSTTLSTYSLDSRKSPSWSQLNGFYLILLHNRNPQGRFSISIYTICCYREKQWMPTFILVHGTDLYVTLCKESKPGPVFVHSNTYMLIMP